MFFYIGAICKYVDNEKASLGLNELTRYSVQFKTYSVVTTNKLASNHQVKSLQLIWIEGANVFHLLGIHLLTWIDLIPNMDM